MSFVLAHLKRDEMVSGPINMRGVVLVVGCRKRALPFLAAQFSLRSACLGDRLLSDSQVPINQHISTMQASDLPGQCTC